MHLLSYMHATRIVFKLVPRVFIDFEMQHKERIGKLPRVVEVALKFIRIKIFYGKRDLTHQPLLPVILVAATVTGILVVVHHLLVTRNHRQRASILHASPKTVHRVCGVCVRCVCGVCAVCVCGVCGGGAKHPLSGQL